MSDGVRGPAADAMYFVSVTAFGDWLEAHHATADARRDR